MEKFDVVIVGGGYAGTMCALRLAGRNDGVQIAETAAADLPACSGNLIGEISNPWPIFWGWTPHSSHFLIIEAVQYAPGIQQ